MGNILTARTICAGYSGKVVLRSIDLTIDGGEVVAVIGHNGSGKSTLLKALYGLMPITAGEITYSGVEADNVTPRALINSGITYQGQGNRVFLSLTVLENLEVAASVRVMDKARGRGVDDVMDLFPPLRAKARKRAGTLSGGEKQMLAFANALVTKPRLLLLDEPSLGLSPQLVRQAFDTIKRVSDRSQISCLVVEQRVTEVLRIAQRVYALRNGEVSFSGPAESLLGDAACLRRVYL